MNWTIVLCVLNLGIPAVGWLWSLRYRRSEDFWDAEVKRMEDQLRKEGLFSRW